MRWEGVGPSGHLLVETGRSLEPQRLIEIFGARMDHWRRGRFFEGRLQGCKTALHNVEGLLVDLPQ